MAQGTRGKWAEKQVKKQLQLYGNYSSFTHFRLPDARAGSLQPTLADFMTMHLGRHALLEVKEVETHDYRLRYTNFDENKVGRMKLWNMAGSDAHVLVCFRPGAGAIWRYAPIDFFYGTRDPDKPSGSWDMSELPKISLQKAMEIMYGPPPSIRP